MIQAQIVRAGKANSGLSQDVRWPFIFLCCAPLLGLRLWMLFSKHHLYDFITYWASGHLFLTGGHPYSQAAMLDTERTQGWPSDQPIVLLCPPWALPFVAIAARWPFRIAQMGWFAISLLLDCASAIGLWIYFGGEKRKAWIAILVCATFIPMASAELLGQINPLMLASLTAFLLLIRSEHKFLAGLTLLGCGIKPHLLYLFFLAILFRIVTKRAWAMLYGALLSYDAATILAQTYNSNSVDYLRQSFNAAMATTCGLGWALRSIFGTQHQWLQFLPCFFGLAWFLWYWSKHRQNWDWQTHFPLLVLVSVSTSPYFWFHDFILVFPAVIAVAVRGAYRSFYALLAYLTLQIIIFVAGLPAAWISPVSVLWIVFYWIADRETKDNSSLLTYPKEILST